MSAPDRAMAQMIVDEILAPSGVPGLIHDRTSHAISAPSALMGELRIAVPAERFRQAVELLELARADGLLPLGTDIVRLL